MKLHYKAKDEELYLHSMGKALKVTAVFTNIEDANNHSAKTEDAVIAEFGPFVFMANRYDPGISKRRTA